MTVSVLWLYLIMPLVGLQCVIMVFPEYTRRLLFGMYTHPLCKVYFSTISISLVWNLKNFSRGSISNKNADEIE